MAISRSPLETMIDDAEHLTFDFKMSTRKSEVIKYMDVNMMDVKTIFVITITAELPPRRFDARGVAVPDAMLLAMAEDQLVEKLS